MSSNKMCYAMKDFMSSCVKQKNSFEAYVHVFVLHLAPRIFLCLLKLINAVIAHAKPLVANPRQLGAISLMKLTLAA